MERETAKYTNMGGGGWRQKNNGVCDANSLIGQRRGATADEHEG